MKEIIVDNQDNKHKPTNQTIGKETMMEQKPFNFQQGEVLLVDKPLTWTSFDVVNKIRYAIKKKLGIKKIKVGHAGTLDPLATGLLIICTGKFTKKIDGFQAQVKEYTGEFYVGHTTLLR